MDRHELETLIASRGDLPNDEAEAWHRIELALLEIALQLAIKNERKSAIESGIETFLKRKS